MENSRYEEPIRLISNNPMMKKVAHEFIKEKDPEEAFLFCNLTDIIKKTEEWRTTLPRVKPFYAVKCNDDEMILRVLAGLGTGFDCASKVEMAKVIEIGVNPSDIIFANPTKQASHIRAAAGYDVRVMTFDNENELHKIKHLHPTAKLVIRIRCDAEQAQCQLGMKFGILVEDAPALLETARQLDLEIIGVSFHVGSGCLDPPVFHRAIASARWLFEVAADFGFKFNFLDIGGGFPGNTGTSIKEIGQVVNDAIEKYFPEESGVDVVAEPGRFFVASSCTLLTQIHSIREVKNTPGAEISGKSFMYYINDGVYGSFNCVLYDHAVVHPETLRLDEAENELLAPASIWGPTCDGLDQVCPKVMLPQMKLGEWLLFKDMGAYTIVAAGTFNGFPVPKVHYLATEESWNLLKEILFYEPLVVPNTVVFLKDGLGFGRDTVGWGISTDSEIPHPINGMVELSNITRVVESLCNSSNNDQLENFEESLLVSPGSAYVMSQDPSDGHFFEDYKTDIPAQ